VSESPGPPREPWSGGPPSGPPPGYSVPQGGLPPSGPAPWGYGSPPAGPPPATPPAERDRLAVHLVWEGILVVVAVVLAVVILAGYPSRAYTNVLDQAAYIGLIATGLALSLRTGTPNLAVGSIAAFTGGFTAYLMTDQQWSMGAAVVVALVVAVVIGVLVGVLVAALSVPAWAATLGAALTIEVILPNLRGGRSPFSGNLPILVRDLWDYSTGLWVGLFVVASVGGGVLWLLPKVRTALSASRQAGEPGRWGGLRPGLGAVVGIGGSSLLAGLGGIAQLIRLKISQPTGTQSLTTMALAAVLLGGVSVFGRRAGVAGTALGVLVLVSGFTLLIINGQPQWVQNLYVGLIILLGLGVSRGLESITTMLNAPRPASPAAPPPQPPPNLFTR
jgi:ribose/xylose/arabinose/galactoside ABC-type transport system permease subunit